MDRRSRRQDASGAIVFTETPPLIIPTFNVVFGERGNGIASSSAISLDNLWMAFGRPKSPGVPAGASDSDAKSPTSDCDMCYTSQVMSFKGYDGANVRTGSQHLTNSPQVA